MKPLEPQLPLPSAPIPAQHSNNLPPHLRELITETPDFPWGPSDVFLNKALFVDSSNRLSSYVYTHLASEEQLSVRFERLFRIGGVQFGVLLAEGAAWEKEVILGRSPAGGVHRFRVWEGREKGFMGEEGEVRRDYRRGVVKVEAAMEGGGQEIGKSLGSGRVRKAGALPATGRSVYGDLGRSRDAAIRLSPDISSADISFASKSMEARGSTVRQEIDRRRASKRPRILEVEDNDDEIMITSVSTRPHIKTEPSEDRRQVPQARDVKVHFVDENSYIRRERSWRHCNSSERIFAHALAAGLLQTSSDVSVLKVIMGDVELPMVKGDKEDFGQLVDIIKQGHAVKREDGAAQEGMVVEVRRL